MDGPDRYPPPWNSALKLEQVFVVTSEILVSRLMKIFERKGIFFLKKWEERKEYLFKIFFFVYIIFKTARGLKFLCYNLLINSIVPWKERLLNCHSQLIKENIFKKDYFSIAYGIKMN